MIRLSTAIAAAALLLATSVGSSTASASIGLAAARRAPASTHLARLIIAPRVETLCPGADDPTAATELQEAAMLCLTNAARQNNGLAPLSGLAKLDRSAGHKSGDILRCDAFSHEACGRDFTYWMERVGYIPARCWRAGENIAWGTGRLGTAASIFSAWMNDPAHRQNILGSYRQIGIGLRVGGLGGRSNAHVWTQQFGTIC
jgi:uncharacterized protein YkwD